ncbi:hypothetical protein IG193_02070 [Infirmifilum lucidum]|uniref:Uncharacterized protein n=1 Tax=Infirmifilum lucidum TaxID=2776706 RepID=A0A7L9FIU2_9CREN|nr:hypothetical protein [Infirmifilum lucidum]QOJ79272.1 hypothetical protein IG193_02070 [Infirmifilum lucidum]
MKLTLSKNENRILQITVSLVTSIAAPIFLLGLYSVMHHVSYGQLADSYEISHSGHIPLRGFCPLTPVPFVWGAVVFEVLAMDIMHVNLLFTVLFLTSLGMLSVSVMRQHRLAALAVISPAIVLLYPSTIYEFGFHHQWFAVLVFAFTSYTAFKFVAHDADYGRVSLLLSVLGSSLALSHPFTLIHFISLVLAMLFLASLLHSNRGSRNLYVCCVSSILVSIASTVFNETLMNIVKRDYIPFLKHLELLVHESLRYSQLVTTPPPQGLLPFVGSIVVKIYIVVVFIIPYIALLLNRFSLKNRSVLIFTVSLTSSVAFYMAVGLTLLPLTLAFTGRWLWHFVILPPYTLYILSLMPAERKKLGKLMELFRHIFTALCLIGLATSPLATVERVPLKDYYAVYSPYTIALNKVLQHLSHGVSLTPGYYLMKLNVTVPVDEVALYTFKDPQSRIKALHSTDVVILSNGLKLQLMLENTDQLYNTLLDKRDKIYDQETYAVLWRV